MPLRWDRLRVLHEVAQEESITAAADILHLTGPAVSAQIRRLEREVGVSLIERDGRGIRLTAAGHVLAGHAALLTQQVERAVDEVIGLQGKVAGPLRLGSVNATMREIVPAAVRRLKAEHPLLEISAEDGEASTFLPMLRAGDLDVVIAESWENRRLSVPPGVVVERLMDEDVDLAVPAGHALADRAWSDLSDLSDQQWIACPAGAEAHHGMIQALRERGTEPRIAFTVTDFATQLEIVRAGLALALVPRIAQPWSAGGVVFVPCRPAVSRSFVVLHREGSQRPAVAACLEVLHDVAQTRGEESVDLSR